MKTKLFIISAFICLHLHAQEKRTMARLYINPSIGISPTQHRVLSDYAITSKKLTKKASLVWGTGAEVLKRLKNNLCLGADLALLSKGRFKVYDTVYASGSFAGTNYISPDLFYFETTVFIEKQILLKKTAHRLLFSSGIFYGTSGSRVAKFLFKNDGFNVGNDTGISFAAGMQKKHLFTKLDFKKGLVSIINDYNAVFRTNVFSFKIGYVI